MGLVTLATMRRLVRERADHETLSPATAEVEDSPELDGYINGALAGFHGLMFETQRHEWPVTPSGQAQATGDGVLEAWLLPMNAQHVVAVRVRDGSEWYNVPDFVHHERSGLMGASRRSLAVRHRVNGRHLEIIPAVRSGSLIEITYWSEFEPLTQPSHSFQCPAGWEQWPAWKAVWDIKTKEDYDATQAKEQLMFWDRAIRANAPRRAGRLRIHDRWPERREPAFRMRGIPRLCEDS